MSINYDDRRWDRILQDRYLHNRYVDNKFRERVRENERREKERADAELRSREEARRSREEALEQQIDKAFDANDFDGARRALDLLLVNYPDDPALHVEHIERRHWLLLRKGQCFLSLERYDEALAIFDKSLRLSRLTSEQTVSRYFWLGRTYYAKENFIMAEIQFDNVLEWKRKHSSAHYWRARCLLHRGKYEEAIAGFTTDLTISPGEPNALYYRGLCHMKMGDSVQGRRDLHRAIELFTKEADEEGVRLAREALDSVGRSPEKPPKTSAIPHPAPTTALPLAAPMAGPAHALPIWQLRKIGESSKVDVDHLLQDPSLSTEEKVKRLMSVTTKMDQDIEHQAQSISSLQQQSNPGQSIDVETMKLNHLIDKRSQVFDATRPIIHKYNRNVEDILDSLSAKKVDKP